MALYELPPKTDDDLKSRETPPTVERKRVTSLLENAEGGHTELSVAITEDGKARRVNFWDIDNCLVYTHSLFEKYLARLFPQEDSAQLHDIFQRGSKLGNSFREFHRMLLVYEDGKKEYEDAELYYRTFIADDEMRAKVDGPGSPEQYHERAAEVVKRLGQVAAEVMSEVYEKDHNYFRSETFLNGPLMHLLQAKARLGEANVLMTANPRLLAETVAKYAGLSDYCIDVAGDEDMVGGGKEKAIEVLIDHLKKMGIPIPEDRLVALGDSERGDVGSGWKLAQEKGYEFEGVLVKKDQEELDQFKEVLASDPDLQAMFRGMDVTAIASGDLPKGKYGYKLGKKGRHA